MNVQGLAQSLGCRLVEAIEKGWSGDRKFLLEDGAGERFVLRLSAKQEEPKKRREFERVRRPGGRGSFAAAPPCPCPHRGAAAGCGFS